MRDVLYSVYMACGNGMDTEISRGSCVERMRYLCMKMSWRCVGRSLQIGGVVGMRRDNVADVKFWVTVACMEGNSVRD